MAAVEVFVFREGRFTGSRSFSALRVTTIGSDPGSALVLADPTVAPRHAVIHVDGPNVHIACYGDNAVEINGRRLDQAIVSGSDEVRIGVFRLKIEVAGERSPSTASRDVQTDDLELTSPETVGEEFEPTTIAVPGSDAPPPLELDEDEGEEIAFVAPFSLLENVLRDRFEAPIDAEPTAMPEVVTYREQRLVRISRVERGAGFSIFDAETTRRVRLFAHLPNGRLRVFFDRRMRGTLVVGGESASLDHYRVDSHLADKKRGVHQVELRPGDCAHLKLDETGHLLRFVRAPKPPKNRIDLRLGRDVRNYFALAAMCLAVLLFGIWLEALIAPKPLLAMEEEIEFADVTLKDLELEKPRPPPVQTPPPPEPPAEVQAVQAKPEAPEPKAEPRRAPRSRRTRPGPAEAAEVHAEKALAALENIVPTTRDRRLSERVSNIAATRVPTGATKRFFVAAPTSKLSGGDIVLATSSGGRDTRAAARLLEGKDVGGVQGSDGVGQRVRAVVTRAPERSIGASGGHLSRSAIANVVAAGTPEVQRCYERELIKNPRLQGKIVFDWVIAASGGVSSTRVRSSSLDSPRVASCIAEVIKGWQFPEPTGGTVKVTYPFVFRVQGF